MMICYSVVNRCDWHWFIKDYLHTSCVVTIKPFIQQTLTTQCRRHAEISNDGRHWLCSSIYQANAAIQYVYITMASSFSKYWTCTLPGIHTGGLATELLLHNDNWKWTQFHSVSDTRQWKKINKYDCLILQLQLNSHSIDASTVAQYMHNLAENTNVNTVTIQHTT